VSSDVHIPLWEPTYRNENANNADFAPHQITEDEYGLYFRLDADIIADMTQSELLEWHRRVKKHRKAIWAIGIASHAKQYPGQKDDNLPDWVIGIMRLDIDDLRPFVYIDYVREVVEKFDEAYPR
jgi:hypothetical protein